MGESDRKEKKDKLFCKRDIWFIIVTLLGSIALIFLIAWLVRLHEGKEWIDLKTWLSYYGSIGGAMFGGCITAIGLYITFRINNKQLEEQRKIDNKRWENSNKQFNHQMKIQIINEKINDYKKCIEAIDEYIYENEELLDSIYDYHKNLIEFIERLDIINENIYGMDMSEYKECNKDIFDILKIVEHYKNSKSRLEVIKMNSRCIKSQYIEDKLNECIKENDNSIEYCRFIVSFDHDYKFTKQYSDYFANEKKMYKSLCENIYKMNTNIIKYSTVLGDIAKDFVKVKSGIRGEIGKLYSEKYNMG